MPPIGLHQFNMRFQNMDGERFAMVESQPFTKGHVGAIFVVCRLEVASLHVCQDWSKVWELVILSVDPRLGRVKRSKVLRTDCDDVIATFHFKFLHRSQRFAAETCFFANDCLATVSRCYWSCVLPRLFGPTPHWHMWCAGLASPCIRRKASVSKIVELLVPWANLHDPETPRSQQPALSVLLVSDLAQCHLQCCMVLHAFSLSVSNSKALHENHPVWVGSRDFCHVSASFHFPFA